MQVNVKFPVDAQLSSEDIEFLRTVARIIGDAQVRSNEIANRIGGIAGYGAHLSAGELEAAHTALKRFINDKEGGYGPR